MTLLRSPLRAAVQLQWSFLHEALAINRILICKYQNKISSDSITYNSTQAEFLSSADTEMLLISILCALPPPHSYPLSKSGHPQ